MRKTKHLSRILSLVLAVVLVLGVFVLPTPAKAVAIGSGKMYFYVTIKTCDESNAGTDSNIYLRAYDRNNNKIYDQKIPAATGDLERGDKDSYTIKTNCDYPLYCIDHFAIYHDKSGTASGWRVQWVTIDALEANTSSIIQTIYKNEKQWIDGYEYKIPNCYNGGTAYTYRDVETAFESFNNGMSGSAIIGPNSGSSASVTWTTKSLVDGVYTSAYNPFSFPEAPTYEFKVYAAVNGSEPYALVQSSYGNDKSLFSARSGNDGFTYNPTAVLNKMRTDGYFALKVVSTLKFSNGTYDKSSATNSNVTTAEYYIYRSEFEAGTPWVNENYYTAATDNYYFNSDPYHQSIVLYYPIIDQQKHQNYAGTDVAQHLTADEIKLYYGPSKDDYLGGYFDGYFFDDSTAYARIAFSAQGVNYEKKPNSGSDGMKLYLKNVRTTDGKLGLYNTTGTTVPLYDNYNVTLGTSDYYCLLSKYKLDTVPPEIYIQEKGASGNGQFLGKWQKTATLITSPKNNEVLYYDKKAGFFDMTLAPAEGSGLVEYYVDGKNTLSEHQLIASKSGLETVVSFPEGIETKLNLTVTGSDFAGNPYTKTYENALWIDTQAPYVTDIMMPQNQAADGSKSIYFNFGIAETTNTARVNYCFVPENGDIPSETEGKQTSGVIEVTTGWAFIEQSDVYGSTVVLKLNAGESFSGQLYYYAVDAAGNRSEMKTSQITIQNQNAGCTVSVEPYTHPLPNYNITFTPDPETTSDNGKLCDVYYRYSLPKTSTSDYTPVTEYTLYNPSGTNPGSSTVNLIGGGSTVLNGTYILEYKAVNTTSGNVELHEGSGGISLIFDNSAPTVEITRTTAGSSLDSQSFRLFATDLSGIASASYTVTPYGGETSVYSEVLKIPQGADTLSTNISTLGMGLPNGAYVLTLTATDRNGVSRSQTTASFSVRTQKPTVGIKLNGNDISGTMILNNPDYTFNLTVTDSFAGTPGSQSVFWRVAGSDSVYTGWQKLADLSAGSGTLSASADLVKPLLLAEGLNSVRLQFLCAESGKDPNKEAVSNAGLLTLDLIQIQLDTTAPTARWSATSGRSRTKLTGTLTVSDALTKNPTVTAVTPGVTIKARSTKNSYTVTYTLAEGAAIPEKLVLNLADNAGNVREFLISTELLDIEGPAVAISAPAYQVYGDRQDAVVTVTVTEEYPGSVVFDLDPAADTFSYYMETSDGVYTVVLQGYTGDMPFSVTATDDLGNATTAVSGAITVKTGTIAEPQIVSAPAYASDSALTVLRFNLPAIAAATEEEALSLAEEAKAKGSDHLKGSCLLIPAAGGTGKQACTVWVADGFGNTQSFTLTPETSFGTDIPVFLSVEQYLDGAQASGTVNALVAGTHIPDPSDPADSAHEYAARVVVEADASTVPHALFPYTILTASDERSGSTGEPSGAKTRIAACDPEDYDDKDSLLAFLALSPESDLDPYGLCIDPFDVAFSRMTFDVTNSGEVTTNAASAKLNIGLYLQVKGYGSDDEDSGDGQTVYIRVPYADRMSFSGTYTISPDASPYTLETTLGEYDIWMNKTLDIGLPIISIAPQITYDYLQNTIEPVVELNANVAGSGAEIALFKLLKQEADGSWTAVSTWTANDPASEQTIRYRIPAEEAGFYCLYAVNEYGLSTLTETFEVTVYSEPIDETDYTLTVFAEVDGRLQEVTGEEPYANSATVRITLTAEGEDRGLYAKNCPSLETVLTPEASEFTFQLADQYGYTLDVPVSYSHFDVIAPTVEYELPDVGKTNQAYSVTITVTDEESGVSSVTLTGPNGNIGLGEADGTWIGRIADSGSYLITAADKLGNKTQRTFTVSNIDTTLPTATITRSVPEGVLTLQPVTVYLSFDKPNVLITKVEKISGEFTQDKMNKTLTFSKNGAAVVQFRDDYGNEGYVTVTVNNIYDEPPHVVAVPVLSADELSVSVTFEMERGADGAPLDLIRELGDLTIIHNGVAYRADEAVYLLGDNGTYTFTVVDQVGLMQIVKLTVTDIDRTAPQITEVCWSYAYFDDDGVKHNATYNLSTIRGAGYRIAADLYPMTNENVTVTVTTDAPTSIIGSYGGEKTTDHTLIYYENGMYIYNLEKKNGLSVNYGVDVEIIDKTPPEITLENPEYLMFIEIRDQDKNIRSMLTDYTAVDTYLGVTTDLTDKVTVDFGGLDPDDLNNNVFDKSKPYTITYSVKDAAGNEMVVTRTVVLIGINDVLVTVNGILPDVAGMAEAKGGSVKLELVNFSGISYTTYAKGIFTFGQMKRTGTVLPRQADGSFLLTNLEDGWYTFFIQTETRDYFNICVYVR